MEIDRVYIDGVPADELGFSIEINGPGSGDDIVGENELATITVVASGGFEPGTSYEVKILTKNNRQITFSKRTTQGSMVIPPPQIIEDLRYIDVDTSNVDGYSDLGTLTNFVNTQTAPDSSYATLSEARLLSSSTYDFIEIGGIDVDGVQERGAHSNFDNLKTVDSILDTLSEEDTDDPETGFRVYHGSFEFASGTTSVRAIGATVDPAHSFLVVYTAGTR